MLSELACTLSERIVSGYAALWITITNCCTGLPTSSACHIKKAIKCSYPIVIVCLTQLEDGLRKENKSDMGEHQLGHLKKGQGFITIVEARFLRENGPVMLFIKQ